MARACALRDLPLKWCIRTMSSQRIVERAWSGEQSGQRASQKTGHSFRLTFEITRNGARFRRETHSRPDQQSTSLHCLAKRKKPKKTRVSQKYDVIVGRWGQRRVICRPGELQGWAHHLADARWPWKGENDHLHFVHFSKGVRNCNGTNCESAKERWEIGREKGSIS